MSALMNVVILCCVSQPLDEQRLRNTTKECMPVLAAQQIYDGHITGQQMRRTQIYYFIEFKT